MKKKLTVLFALIILAPMIAAGASEARTPTFEEILSFETPGGTSISPDGRFILYTVKTADMEDNTYVSTIWMANVKESRVIQMTRGSNSSYTAAWAPDSKSFAFLREKDGKNQIHIMSAFGGEARSVTSSKTGVNNYCWSPDGQMLAFTAKKEKSEKKKETEKTFGKFEIVDDEQGINHIWIKEIDSHQPARAVMDKENMHVGDIAWSPDGKKIAFTAQPDSRMQTFSKSDIYILTFKDNNVAHLVNQNGPDHDPVWSPDSAFIAFNTTMGAEEYYINTHICAIPAKGGKIEDLTPRFDEDTNLLAWTKQGIWFEGFSGMKRHLYRISGKSNRLQQITNGEDCVLGGCSISKDGKTIGFSNSGPDQFREVYVSGTDRFRPKKLTDFSRQAAGWTLSTKEAVSWKSKDGTTITGVLIKPANFDATKKYPLLVVIHGGPSSISIPQKFDRMGTYYPIEQWAAKGAVILEPNYRGSTGFGQSFRQLNVRNLGLGDYDDVITGVDHLIDRGFIDPDRLAAMGWSQGGYISAFITCYSDRFKATSVGAGISDWITYYVNTDITPFTRIYLKANPWEDEDIYRKTSPMTYIKNAKTPTLIQHGEFDRRVPIPNAYKLYRGLKDRNVPVKFVVYKGFGHGISKPKEKLAVLTHNFEWFNHYIWGESN